MSKLPRLKIDVSKIYIFINNFYIIYNNTHYELNINLS